MSTIPTNSEYSRISDYFKYNFIQGEYEGGFRRFPAPEPVESLDENGEKVTYEGVARKGRTSLFNRYSVFFYNNIETQGKGSPNPEPYFDQERRSLYDKTKGKVVANPSAGNIIAWSKYSGKAAAVDYDWSDFLWCKNYGVVPNNYMITLRRFSIPVMDDLSDLKKNPAPDVARMIAWVDGETNKFENVGLKFSTKINWKELESEVQILNSPGGYGNEGGAFGGVAGNVMKSLSWASQPGSNQAALGSGESSSWSPYQDKNKTLGPIDVIKKMYIRERGLEFTQEMTVTFEYEMRSIDGVNPKIAMMDLFSNVLMCTFNRGSFWGGEIKYTGGNPRAIKPIGDPSKLAKGDYGGYLSSLLEGLSSRFDSLTGGAGLSLEGIGNAAKNLGGSMLSNIVGGGLDKMGRPGVQGVNSLLTGEDTGEWHLTVGNPANPIISMGNLILDKTDFQFSGALGPDDFPTKLKVVCTLKPARHRERTDIMAMFHRNGRMYITELPGMDSFSPPPRQQGGPNGQQQQTTSDAPFGPPGTPPPTTQDIWYSKFPNHINQKGPVIEGGKGIG